MNRKISIPANIRYVSTVMLLLLGLNFLLRVAFLLNNFAQAQAIESRELLSAFLMGVRFDLATILIVNGLIFLFLMTPLRMHSRMLTYKVINVFVLILNIPVLLLNGVDVIYFGFSERRLTHELYTTRGDLLNVPPREYFEFWPYILGVGIVIFALYKILSKLTIRSMKKAGDQPREMVRPRSWVLPLIAGLFIITGIRGGLQHQLRPGNAFITDNHFAGFLGLNSAYTVINSMFVMKRDKPPVLVDESEAIETVRFAVHNDFDLEFASDEYPLLRKTCFDSPEKDYNVVVLILESFNADNVGVLTDTPLEESITPAFDQLAAEGMLYTNYHSNGSRSVEALPAILNSIPELYSRPIIGSEQEKNANWGIGNMLESRNYHTSFFHGGKNGTMGFDRYCKTSGLNHYFGKDEYPEPERDYDGAWGIYDDPFMQNMHTEMCAFPEPFFSAYFSISNHHPFGMPESGYEHIKERTDLTPFQRTTQYSDEALGHFFEKAKQEDWYERTIFIVTADHTNHDWSDPDKTVMDYSHVPLLIIGPEVETGVSDLPANHINLLPTLIDLLQLDTYHASTGVSLFSKGNSPRVLTDQGVITLACDSRAVSTGLQTPKCFQHFYHDGVWYGSDQNIKLPPGLQKEMEFELKSFYQVIRDLRMQNRMVPESL